MNPIPYFLIFLALSACQGKVRSTFIDVSSGAMEEAVQGNPHFARGEWPEIKWWERFEDPLLNLYVTLAIENSPTLEMAYIKIKRAFASAKEAEALLWPQLNYKADVTQYEVSKTGAFGGVLRSPDPNLFPFTYNQQEMFVNGNFNFDLWGETRSGIKAAKGEGYALTVEAYYARTLLAMNVAESYFVLRTYLKNYEILEKGVQTLKELADLSRLRRDKKLSSEFEVLNYEQQVVLRELDLKVLKDRINYTTHKLQALIADDFKPLDAAPLEDQTAGLTVIPEDLELNFLAHRPDVEAALWRVWEGTNLIRSREASFYPNITFSGLIGYQTIEKGKLFSDLSIFGDYGPALQLPLFDGGLRWARLQDEVAKTEIAIQNYNQTVLNAVQDTLDALMHVENVKSQVEGRREYKEIAGKKYAISQAREKNKLDSRLAVLQSYLEMLGAERDYYQILADSLISEIDLIGALGGGYGTDCSAR